MKSLPAFALRLLLVLALGWTIMVRRSTLAFLLTMVVVVLFLVLILVFILFVVIMIITFTITIEQSQHPFKDISNHTKQVINPTRNPIHQLQHSIQDTQPIQLLQQTTYITQQPIEEVATAFGAVGHAVVLAVFAKSDEASNGLDGVDDAAWQVAEDVFEEGVEAEFGRVEEFDCVVDVLEVEARQTGADVLELGADIPILNINILSIDILNLVLNVLICGEAQSVDSGLAILMTLIILHDPGRRLRTERSKTVAGDRKLIKRGF